MATFPGREPETSFETSAVAEETNRGGAEGASTPEGAVVAGTKSPSSWLKRKTAQGGAVVLILGAALKFKTVLLLILTKLKFLLVALKLGKFLSTFASMFLMVVVYAQIYGWLFGVGFVVLMLIHEMGHYLMAQYLGLPVGAPIFIPFVGAFIAMKGMPRDAVLEAKMALGGPLLGTLSALVCVGVYFVTGLELFLALAYVGFILNLFNLIPLHPLDGGRTVAAISPWLWLIGIPLGLVVSLRFFNPIILLMLVLGVVRLFEKWRAKDQSYYSVPVSTRWAFAAVYFGLLAVLGVGMAWVYAMHGGLSS